MLPLKFSELSPEVIKLAEEIGIDMDALKAEVGDWLGDEPDPVSGKAVETDE